MSSRTGAPHWLQNFMVSGRGSGARCALSTRAAGRPLPGLDLCARGRSRTDTLLRAADLRATSAFAAPPHRASRVRGLEHAFTVAMQAVGARRLLSTPSLRLAQGLARRQLERLALQGLHRV